MSEPVLVRADASTVLGAGHVARCLALAGRLREAGLASRFLCRRGPGDMLAAIAAAGHAVSGLEGALADDPLDPAADAAACLAALGPEARAARWIVSDHFGLDARWERAMRAATGARVLAVDGRANRPHDADLLLDPVGLPGSEGRWDALLPPHCRRLVGPRYAPLRPEFRAALALPAAAEAAPKRLVLAFGGVDAPDATGRALAALLAHGGAGAAAIDVVVGAGYPHGAALAALAARAPRVTVHRQPAGLAALMRRAHAALCAGGGTLLELCTLQVPALVVQIADNQAAPAAALAGIGCAVDLGPLARLDGTVLARASADLLADASRRATMRAAQAALTAPPAHDAAHWMLDSLSHP